LKEVIYLMDYTQFAET